MIIRNKMILLVVLALFSAVQILAQNKVIKLYEGIAPGSENWDWEEKVMKMGDNDFVYNIVSPEMIVFKADPAKATGQAIIVCPGGGFHFLSMKNEGYDVAKWLNEKGITAFVLKYRTEHCLTDNPMTEFMQKGPNTEKFNKDIEPVVAMGIEDGKTAVSYVREHAGEFGIQPDHIGIIGFSAGGTVTTGVAFKYDQKSRPDFAALIYPYVGSFGSPSVPEDAPPIFIAAATDDTFGFQVHCTRLYNQWTEAGKSAALHIYRLGGHGFGMQKQNLPVDHWIDCFYEWLVALEN